MNRMQTLTFMRKKQDNNPRDIIIEFVSAHISDLMEICRSFRNQRQEVNAIARLEQNEYYFKLNIQAFRLGEKIYTDLFFLKKESELKESYHNNFAFIVNYIRQKLILSGCQFNSKIEYPNIQFEFEWIKR